LDAGGRHGGNGIFVMASDQMRPVFVVGCQRSGSTLLGAMLGAHPEIVCVPEGQFIVDLMPGRGSGDTVDPTEIIERITKHWRFRIWGFDLGAERPAPGEIEPTYRAAVEWLVARFAAAHDRRDARVWVDQQPGHVFYLWRLLKHFPNAKVVHIVRDGRAVAASIMPLDWGPNEIYGAARFWQMRIGLGYAAASFLGPDQLHHLRYEDLVREPEATLGRLADFMGVAYHEDMLRGTGLSLPAFTKDQHSLVGGSLAPGRIDAWQQSLTRRQIEIFERLTSNLLAPLGYDLISSPGARRMTLTEKAVLVAKDQVKKVINSLRFEWRRRAYLRKMRGGSST
jgi:hypothetical protein